MQYERGLYGFLIMDKEVVIKKGTKDNPLKVIKKGNKLKFGF